MTLKREHFVRCLVSALFVVVVFLLAWLVVVDYTD